MRRYLASASDLITVILVDSILFFLIFKNVLLLDRRGLEGRYESLMGWSGYGVWKMECRWVNESKELQTTTNISHFLDVSPSYLLTCLHT
jgi:hypothetical protein